MVPKNKNLIPWASELRSLVYQNIGIPISIGIGNTKVQAKIANYFAKKIEKNSGIFDIGIIENKDDYLKLIEVEKIWGVGKKMSDWFKNKGIKNALELRDMSREIMKMKYGIVGLRLQNELKDRICIPIKIEASKRKEICVSRSFSYPIDNLEELKQAISYYVLIASAKLRVNNQLTSAITVFTRTNIYSKDFFKREAKVKLTLPSNDPRTILKSSLLLTEKIFKPYRKLIKAGVIMHKLESNKYQQKLLFNNKNCTEVSNSERLTKIIDKINKKYGKDTLNWSASTIKRDWTPRRDKVSNIKTTNINNIPTVLAT